jgi:hypothetical protein
MTGDLLDCVLSPRPPAFALIYRPEYASPAMLEILVGLASTQSKLVPHQATFARSVMRRSR